MPINKTNISNITITFFCFFSSFLILYYVLKFSSYGIDFTDEGYYLNWISNPFIYKSSISQFGYVYHPLYNLVNGDIGSLRRLNFIITFILSSVLVYILIKKLFKNEEINILFRIIISIGIAISSFTYLYIQTPSYNHLTLQALLLTNIGILLVNKKNLNVNIIGYVIIGVGGWLAFMAKPSSAIGAGIVVLAYLIISKQFELRFIFVALFFSLLMLVLSALAIDHSLTTYINRYILSLKSSEILNSGHDFKFIFRIDPLNLSYKIKEAIFFVFIIAFSFIWLGLKSYKFNNSFFIMSSFIILAIITVITGIKINWNPNYGTYQAFKIFGITLAFTITYIILILKNKIRLDEIQFGLLFLFLTMPYIFSLGSNNNYWGHSGIASIFWAIANLILIAPLHSKFNLYQPLIILVLISQLITSIHIKERIENPYRYNETYRLSDTSIVINNKNNKLFLSTEFIKYITNSRKVLSHAGFQKGDSIIDLTGQSPGLIYLLGGKSIGSAWNIGGYKGSLDYAKANFSLVSCESIANAWVLNESKHPKTISIELLHSLGANFPDQYELVGSWETAKGRGVNSKKRVQKFYKPYYVNDILQNCNELRNKNNH